VQDFGSPATGFGFGLDLDCGGSRPSASCGTQFGMICALVDRCRGHPWDKNSSLASSIPTQPTMSFGTSRREGLILLTLSALQFVSMVDFMIIMPLGPQLQLAFDIDAMRFNWTVSAYTFSAGIAGIVAAPLLDRFGRRATYLVLTLGLLACTMGCGLSTRHLQLLVMRCVTGAFGGLHGAVTLALVADVVPPERRGRALGVLMSAFGLASVVGVPIGIVLGTRHGWQVPFLVLAMFGLPLAGLAAWILPPLTGQEGLATRRTMADFVSTLTLPPHRWAFTLAAVLMFGAFAVIPDISTALVANVGVTEAQLPAVFIVGGIITFATTPLVGHLVDRFGALRVFSFTVPLSAAIMVVMTHLPAVGLIGAAPVVALLMATNTGRMVSATTLVMASVAPRRRGGFMSVNSSVQHIASGLGTLCAGLIIEGSPGQPLRNFGTVGLLAATATIASLWIAPRVRPFEASGS